MRKLTLSICALLSLVQPAPASDALHDPTLAKGYVSTTAADAGIVVHLHGCNGLRTGGWVQAWFRHLEGAGFKVFAPDSFAEARPAESCANPFPNKEEIYTIRIRQTLSALRELQAKYPDKPVYMWGHSEGGALANRLEVKVDGIVTTGHQCGYRLTAASSVRPDVPLLVLMGSDSKDHYIRGVAKGTGHASVASLCERVLRNKIGRWVQLERMGHMIPIWDPEVSSLVNAFLGIKTPYAGPDGGQEQAAAQDVALSPGAAALFKGKYRGLSQHKAFAIGPRGVYGYSQWGTHIVDAEQEALYYCNEYLRNRLSLPGRRCTLYAINDTVVLRTPGN